MTDRHPPWPFWVVGTAKYDIADLAQSPYRLLMAANKTETTRKLVSKALRAAVRSTSAVGAKAAEYAAKTASDLTRRFEPPSRDNWYPCAASRCEAVSDAILNDKRGTSERVVHVAAGKLGAFGVPAAIFSTAALIGTASTGTAIGSLSGAAFTSAALAWVGGSVALGGVILGVAAAAGGIGAVIGAGWVAKKYVFGKKRTKADLDERERRTLMLVLRLRSHFGTRSGLAASSSQSRPGRFTMMRLSPFAMICWNTGSPPQAGRTWSASGCTKRLTDSKP